MLNDHAPIVSLLQEGDVKFDGSVSLPEDHAEKFTKNADGKHVLAISSGTIEMKDNKVIVLAD